MDSSEQVESTNVPPQTSPTTAPQVRSRITVVCAECKRLKLKCDRKIPCGSCVKRETLPKCIYSPAAAEKVDLQSLNNRLMQVEATLAQLTSGQFVSSYPLSARPPPPSSSSVSKPLASSQQLAFVQAASGSAFTFPLEDVRSIWLDELDLGSSLASSSSQVDSLTINLKLEPDSTPISPADNADAPKSSCQPLPSISIYYPPSSSSSSSLSQSPCLSPALLGLLPPSVSSQQSAITSPYTLQNLLHLAENSVAHTYPSLNWKHLRSRAMKMVALLDNSAKEKRAKAMEIFFGQRQITSPAADVVADGDSGSKESVPFFATICAALALGSSIAGRCDSNVDPIPAEQNSSRKGKTRKLPPSHSGASAAVHTSAPPSPLYWYSLSAQALSVHEGSTIARLTGGTSTLDYDLDYLTACLLQVIFLLKCGYSMVAEECRDMHSSQKGVEGVIFPLVGKMVNIARQIGLTVDPEENANSGDTAIQNTRKTKGKSSGTPSSTIPHFSLFESEMRRRIWWDVLYYDLFVSDAMGHPPLIPEKSFSTKLPVTDVDDKAFCPSSSRIPLPRIEDSMGYMKDGLQYFEVKCRMAQLVRNIKRRMASPEPILTQFGHHSHPPGTYSIEQAAFMESEISTWLSQLPQCFRLDIVSSATGSTTESILVAQRCEIAITAQRLIMKVYLPFLKKEGATHVRPPYQAIIAVGNAAHVIIRTSKMLYKHWDSLCTPRDPNSCFPAMFDFYPLPRILFDAAVISAYSVLKHPAAWCASAAAEDADTAFDLLKRNEIWRGTGGLGLAGSFDIQQSDALRIVECLRIKLQSNGSPSSMSLKRKLDAVDIDQVAEDQMPDQCQIVQSIPAMEVTESSEERRRCPSPSTKESSARTDSPPKGHTHEKKQAKRGPYPSVGVRVRPGREGSAPFSRPTTRSKDCTFFASSPSQISSDMLYHSRPTDKETSPLPDSAMSRSRSSSITQDPVQKVHPPQSPQLVAQAGYRVDQQNHSGYIGSPLIYEYSGTHHHQRTASSDYSDSISPYTPTSSNGPLSTANSPYTTHVSTPTYGPSVSTNSEPFNPPHSYYATPPYNYNNSLSNHHSVHAFERETGQSEGDPMTFTGTVCDTAQSAVYDATLPYQQVPLANTWHQPDYWHQSEYKHYS